VDASAGGSGPRRRVDVVGRDMA